MEVTKADALTDIIRLINLGVITYDDLADFSDDLKQDVEFLLERLG